MVDNSDRFICYSMYFPNRQPFQTGYCHHQSLPYHWLVYTWRALEREDLCVFCTLWFALRISTSMLNANVLSKITQRDLSVWMFDSFCVLLKSQAINIKTWLRGILWWSSCNRFTFKMISTDLMYDMICNHFHTCLQIGQCKIVYDSRSIGPILCPDTQFMVYLPFTFTPEELPKCRYIDHTLSIWDMSSVYILERIWIWFKIA